MNSVLSHPCLNLSGRLSNVPRASLRLAGAFTCCALLLLSRAASPLLIQPDFSAKDYLNLAVFVYPGLRSGTGSWCTATNQFGTIWAFVGTSILCNYSLIGFVLNFGPFIDFWNFICNSIYRLPAFSTGCPRPWNCALSYLFACNITFSLSALSTGCLRPWNCSTSATLCTLLAWYWLIFSLYLPLQWRYRSMIFG